MNRLVEALIIVLFAMLAIWFTTLLPIPATILLIVQVIVGLIAVVALLRLIAPGRLGL